MIVSLTFLFSTSNLFISYSDPSSSSLPASKIALLTTETGRFDYEVALTLWVTIFDEKSFLEQNETEITYGDPLCQNSHNLLAEVT